MHPLDVQNETHLYGGLLDNAPLAVAVTDSQGVLVWLNALAKDFLGTDVGHIMLSSKDWPQFRTLLSAEEPFYYVLGDQGFIFVPHVPPLPEKRLLLWIVPSASMEVDLVAMQRNLLHQRKLANLGKMLTEMAHELNNPLAGISMASQLIELSLGKLRRFVTPEIPNFEAMSGIMDKMAQELKKIMQSTGKAANLRQELLNYSKPNQLNLRLYQTCKLLESALSGFEHQAVFRDMTLHKEFAPNSPTILCDPVKLEQILYNLLKNAHDATRGSGVVWIRELVSDTTVTIEFEDNGPGIPPDMLDKLFSPFLTTKPRTGTGLGLSISHQIITEHGGQFSVYNKEHSGACFHIILPIQKIPITRGVPD